MRPPHHHRTPLALRAAICVMLALLFPAWNGELNAENNPPTLLLQNCHEPQPTVSSHGRLPRDVARRFLACFNDVLTTLDSLSVEANRDRLELVQPLLGVYRQLVPETMRLLEDIVLEQLSPPDLRSFESRVLNSNLFEEAVALETFLNAPSTLISPDEKQDKAKILEESIKALIDSVLDALKEKFKPFELPGIVKGIFGVLNEVLKLLAR
jgi:hypothetical protein